MVKVTFRPYEDLVIREFQKFDLSEMPGLRASITLEESGAAGPLVDVTDDQMFCSAAGWLRGEE